MANIPLPFNHSTCGAERPEGAKKESISHGTEWISVKYMFLRTVVVKTSCTLRWLSWETKLTFQEETSILSRKGKLSIGLPRGSETNREMEQWNMTECPGRRKREMLNTRRIWWGNKEAKLKRIFPGKHEQVICYERRPVICDKQGGRRGRKKWEGVQCWVEISW